MKRNESPIHKLRNNMIRSDIWFMGVILLEFLLIIYSIISGHDISFLLMFMWVLLLPYAFIRILEMFFPKLKWNNKIIKWLNKKV